MIIGDKSFKTTDSYRLALDSSHAFLLALTFLWADTSADRGERAGLGDYFIGLTKNNGVIQEYKNEFFTPENLEKIYGIDFKIINNDEKFYIQMFN